MLQPAEQECSRLNEEAPTQSVDNDPRLTLTLLFSVSDGVTLNTEKKRKAYVLLLQNTLDPHQVLQFSAKLE